MLYQVTTNPPSIRIFLTVDLSLGGMTIENVEAVIELKDPSQVESLMEAIKNRIMKR